MSKYADLRQRLQKVAEVDFDTAELKMLAALVQSADAAIGDLEEENDEWEASFKIYWDADMRIIKLWHEAGGDELTWPDKGKLGVWMLERNRDLAKQFVDMKAYADHLEIENKKRAPANMEQLQAQADRIKLLEARILGAMTVCIGKCWEQGDDRQSCGE